MIENYLEIREDVKRSIKENKPVVALESTIISHGMPYPQNIETALEVEKLITENGAIPATIGIINGKIIIGLSKNEIEYLAKAENVLKASRRDLPVVLSRKLDAATTVSATMICANLAGIKIFVTGGIGGVHKDGQNSLDISADLTELSKTNVAVVCAGAKAILDLKLTLEYLETLGVPVFGYKTKSFPAFYSSASGLNVDYNMKSSKEIAEALLIKWRIGLEGGVVISCPIPKEFELENSFINDIINDAINEAKEKKIDGKKLTPFLLENIKERTDGKSLESNIQLIKNNAIIGSQVAVEMSKLSMNGV